MDTLDIGPEERAEARDKGFTLIELLIVIVILGILSVVVVIAVGGITDRGQDSACDSDEKALRTAVEAYLAQNTAGLYPPNEAALVPGFLSEVSSLHDYEFTAPVAAGDPGTYTITGVGNCA